MVKLLVVGIVAAVTFIVFSIVDCVTLPRQRIRSLNKAGWVVVLLVLPLIGAALWFVLGRAPASPRTLDSRYRGPDDDPDFVGRVNPAERSSSEKEQDDATLRQLEQQLLDTDDDGRDRH
jgi:hypothetical protein